MNGQGYLCNYYISLERKNYYHTIIDRCRIVNLDDKQQLAKLISLAGKYATMDLNDNGHRNHVIYLQKIAQVDGLLRQFINSVGRPRVVIVRG